MAGRTTDSGRDALVVPDPARRPLAWFASVVALALVLAAALPVVLVARGMATGHQQAVIEIRDQAGIVDDESLAGILSQMRFRVPVHLAVLTVSEVPAGSLNDAVLDHARSQDTDTPWIDPQNPNYWADGLFILAVAPEARLVGTYFGEDIAVDLDTQAGIQEATKDDFRARDWFGGLAEGARAGAQVIARPWYATVGALIGASVTSALGLGIGGWLGVRAASSRRRLREARTAYANVTRDFDATEIAAGTIPTDQYYGAQVMARFQDFASDYRDLTRAFLALGSPSGVTWCTRPTRDATIALRQRATELDALDDVIEATSGLLSRGPQWRRAWDNEQGPVREDIESLRTLADSVERSASAVTSSAPRTCEALEGAGTCARDAERRLDEMTGELEEGSLAPSDALRGLDEISEQVRGQALVVVGSALAGDEPDVERRRSAFEERVERDSPDQVYSGRWRAPDRRLHDYAPASTIRVHPGSAGWNPTAWWAQPGVWATRSGRTGADTSASGSWGGGAAPVGGAHESPRSGSFSSFTPVSALVVGYSHAVSTDSSTSSTGVSSGGGGFSGTGSSSSF